MKIQVFARSIVVLGVLLAPFGADLARASPPDEGDGEAMRSSDEGEWSEIETRIEDRQLQEASDRVEELLDRARAEGRTEDWTRALVVRSRLRTALSGFETAVADLRAAEWPEDPAARGLLHLVLAEGLATYLRSSSWEIGQREPIDTDEPLELDQWSRGQIVAATDGSFRAAWDLRDAWGDRELGRFAEYFETGTLPSRIRDTRRQVVATLWAEWLRDSSLWSAAESSAAHRLNLPRLAAGEPLDEGSVLERSHPLERLAALLGELERWHLEHGRPEAAFEAARSRLEALWGAFDGSEERDALTWTLRERLADLDENLPWRAMGYWTLARWVDATEAPDRRIRARALALEGAESHPGSRGGKACRALIRQIESPEVSLSAMAQDGPRRRSIEVRHRNLERLHFRAWRLDFEALLATADDWNLLPQWNEIPTEVMRRPADVEWSEDLPPTPDFRSHRSFVTPPLEERGLWVVVASVRPDFREQENRRSAVHLAVTDLVTEVRAGDPWFDVRILNGDDGAPVPHAEVELWRLDYRNGHQRVVTGRTDASGRTRVVDRSTGRFSYALLARRGEDVTLIDRLSERTRSLPKTVRGALVFTDRAVYRTGQSLQWKVVAYEGLSDEGRFEVLPSTAGTVRLLDANGEEVARADATTNEFGSASGTLRLPPGRLLGAWRLETSWNGSASIRVEEYERPTFEVEILDPEGPMRLDEPVRLEVGARYYFGLPVSDGDVEWRVTRRPRMPPWWRARGWSPVGGGPEIVAAGSGSLDQEGRFSVHFVPFADEDSGDRPGTSFVYELEADVTELGGETRTGSRSFRLGFVAVEAVLEPEAAVTRPGRDVVVRIDRRDLDGRPAAGPGGWSLARVEVPSRPLLPSERAAEIQEEERPFATPGDRLRPRWAVAEPPEQVTRSWPAGESLRSGSLDHGEDGRAVLELSGLPEGLYRLRYSTLDPWDESFEIARDLRIGGDGASTGLGALLEAEETRVEVGQTARLVVGSGFEDQAMTLELVHGGRAFEQMDLRGDGRLQTIEIPVGGELRGGFTARLTLVRDHQRIERVRDISVPWSDRILEVDVSTFRDLLRPGTTEAWRVTVRGEDGRPVEQGSAEVLAWMFDRSLDLFAPLSPPSVERFYPSRTGVVPSRVSLGHVGEIWVDARSFGSAARSPVARPVRLVVLSGVGIGGPGRGRPMMLHQKVGFAGAPASAAPDVAAEARFLESIDVANDGIPAPAPPPPAPVETPALGLRTDFSETAFWRPHLIVGEDGSVAFEFEVPDALTDWHVHVRAMTRDLRGGSAHRTVRTARELQVRPSLPRFLRQGDRAVLEVVVDNSGPDSIDGEVTFEILDSESGTSLAGEFGLTETERPFRLESGRSTSVSFAVTAPDRLGSVAVVARARAGEIGDGERRPLPLLPSRFQLVRSRFAALSERAERVLRFEDLLADRDPERIDERLVVTIDAQLFTTVLRALPYLARYPYECTEQTLNRFLSASILSRVFADHPGLATLATELSERETLLEPWSDEDPNLRMLRVETPWVEEARGGAEAENPLRLLQPTVAAEQRRAALFELEKAQTSSGGFPWWPGGPPSPYMTLYLLQGFSRAIDVGVEPPHDMIRRAWAYLHRHYLDEMVRDMMERDCCPELMTFLGFVLSSMPGEEWTGGVFTEKERQRMLDHSFASWREQSPLLKSLLARTLHRAGRTAEGRKVFESVMDSATTDPDLGTYWAPEDRAWLWYEDTVETHAIALSTLGELDPDDPRRGGLVQWLLLDKKLGHWKSTRATAEAIHALVRSLGRDGLLGRRDVVEVDVGSLSERLVFEPDDPAPKGRIVLEGEEIIPATGEIRVRRKTQGLVFASATWHFSTDRLPETADGDLLSVTRTFYRRIPGPDGWSLEPLAKDDRLQVGDEVEVRLLLRAAHAAEYVHLRDPRGAGFEPVDLRSEHAWRRGASYYRQVRDSGVDLFFERLPAGEIELRHRLRATTAGSYRVAPARVQSMYAPEFAAHSSGRRIDIARR